MLAPVSVFTLLGPATLASGALAASAAANSDGDPLPTSIEDGGAILHFDPDDPDLGFSLIAIGDQADPMAYDLVRTHLWEIEFRDPAAPGVELVALPDRSLGFAFDFVVSSIDDDDDHGYGGYGGDDDDDGNGGWGGHGDDDDGGGGWGGGDDDDDDGGGWGGDDDDDGGGGGWGGGGWGGGDGHCGDDDGLLLQWIGVTHPSFPNGEAFDVDVRLTAPEDEPYVQFEIAIRGVEPFASQVLMQRFPRVEIVGGPSGASERLVIPYWQGNLYDDPIRSSDLFVASQFLPPERHPGPLNMQWLAYYDESDPSEAMLYWATRDGGGFPKGFRIDPNPFDPVPNLGLSIEHVPVGNGSIGIDHATPFPFTVGVLRGDWYDAARFYREDWALDQPGPSKGTMRENPDFSQTMLDADLFGILGQDFCAVDPPACAITGMRQSDPSNWIFAAQHVLELQAFFGTDDVVYQASNWERNSLAANWGEWLPANSFFEQYFVPQAGAAGITWAPYFNYLTYDNTQPTYFSSDVPGFEGRFVGDFAVTDVDGNIKVTQQIHCDNIDSCNPQLLPEVIGTVQIDAGTPWAVEYTRYIATQLEAYGAGRPAGIYLDVLQGAARLNYSQAVEQDGFHQRGGGRYASDGALTVLDTLRGTLRNDFGNSEYFVETESPFEPAIGDVEFTYGYHGGVKTLDGVRRVVPLYQSVYHDYQRTSSILSLDIPPSSPFIFNASIWLSARQIFDANLFMGHAPYATTRVSPFTFAIRTNPAFFPALAKHLGLARDHTQLLALDAVRDTAVFGQRLRSPQTDSGRSYVQFLIVNDLNPLEQTQPVVYASAYGTPGPDGPIGILLTNWTDAADPLFEPNFGLPLWELGTTPGPQTIHVTIDPDDYDLAPAVYTVREVLAGTGEIVELAEPLDLTAGPASIEVTLGSLQGRYLLIQGEGQGGGCGDGDDDDDGGGWGDDDD
ncbi:DUF6259 domain-containing protein [Engelhardtia mirabilis]|uniref:DUF6259 domain-containing protein n=1 Tax=Engelhardtia mirabilis TaxID=2528011 RepID=UPI003AF33CB7